jgi:hypothetical protein
MPKNILLTMQEELIESTLSDKSKLLAFAETWGERSNIKILLREIKNNRELLKYIADRSYIHTNGFDKLVLADSPSGKYKIRLHIWWPRNLSAIIQEDIHSHYWDFASNVCAGEFLFEQFEERSCGFRTSSYNYNRTGNDAFDLHYCGSGNVETTFMCKMPTGTSYFWDHGLLHRVRPSKPTLTASFVVQTQDRTCTSKVFTSKSLPPRTTTKLQFFSETQLCDRVDKLLSSLG